MPSRRAHPYLKACLCLGLCSWGVMSCINPVVIDNVQGEEVTGGVDTPGRSPDDINMLLAEAALLIRVIPVDDSRGAEVFCVAVALQPSLLITSASCFQGGVRYAEVKRGAQISFQDNEARVGVVTQVYKHPGFIPGIPVNNGYDFAVVKITPPSNFDSPPQVVTLYERDPMTLDTLLRVGYKRGEDNVFQRRVSFGSGTQAMGEVLTFSASAGGDAPCPVSGSPVMAYVNGAPHVVALSAHGDETCTQGGSAGIVNASRAFISDAYEGQIDTSGQNYEVTGDLSCAQFFLCYQVPDCQMKLTMPAQMLMNDLFACINETMCNEFSCYPTACPDEYDLCVQSM